MGKGFFGRVSRDFTGVLRGIRERQGHSRELKKILQNCKEFPVGFAVFPGLFNFLVSFRGVAKIFQIV